MCGEEEAVKQIPNPNDMGSDEMWDVCWECDLFIRWSFEHIITMHFNKDIKPFDEWLFEKEGVYPKHESLSYILKKNKP